MKSLILQKNLFRIIVFSLSVSGIITARANDPLPIQYEFLTAPDFVKAVQLSDSICIIPIGIIEKHGAHLPLGTDMLVVRELALRAAKKEYAIVFPQYYFGQIFEAKHQPGTISYSQQLFWDILQETCDELSRNGIKKIVLVNGHGGNNSFLQFFCQSQLAEKKDYSVILFQGYGDEETDEKVKALRKTEVDNHGGEVETSMVQAVYPQYVHTDRAAEQSGENFHRLDSLKEAYTGIWWYASYPNHYAGDGSYSNPEIGEILYEARAEKLVELIRYLKSNTEIRELEQQFYKQSENPLETPQGM